MSPTHVEAETLPLYEYDLLRDVFDRARDFLRTQENHDFERLQGVCDKLDKYFTYRNALVDRIEREWQASIPDLERIVNDEP